MRGLAAAAAIATLVAAAPARAERIGVIAIAGSAPPVGARELARTTAAAVPDATTDVLAIAAANLRAGAVAATQLERFTQVRALVDEAWQSFLQVQPDYAQARLAKARGDAEELLPLAGGIELYADISLRLGAVLDYLGHRDDAGTAIRVALALDPTRILTEREFSPDVLAAVAAARAVAPPTRTATITGTTPVKGAVEIEVDGVARGTAPIELSLAIGDHVAIARAPGHTPRALAFAIAATGPTELAFALDLDPHAEAAAAGLAAGATDARATAAVEAGLRFGEVDAIVVVAAAWRRNEPAVLVQRCTGIPVRCTPIAEIGYRDASGLRQALRAALAEVATGAATLVAPTLPGDPRVTEGHGPESCITCKPWVWAAGGVVVVAATVLTIVLIDDAPTRPLVGFDGPSVLGTSAVRE